MGCSYLHENKRIEPIGDETSKSCRWKTYSVEQFQNKFEEIFKERLTVATCINCISYTAVFTYLCQYGKLKSFCIS